MLKAIKSLKTLEMQAAELLSMLLQEVPAIKILDIEHEVPAADRVVDLIVQLDVNGKRHTLFCEVKANGQPRHVRMALLQLYHYMAHQARNATPIFIAPYLSPEAQALCREQNVGFLDLEGNARLIFDGVFIERQVASIPIAERRELRSFFKPKSAQVLRVLLRDPHQPWRVTDIAAVADVSLGHVSNVRSGLLEREWARVSPLGLFLSEPDALLDKWRDNYERPIGKHLSLYTTLHGNAFEAAARPVLCTKEGASLAMFASFSAAQWLAPYGRTGAHYFYADAAGLEQLRSALKLESTTKGGNVEITLLNNAGLFRDAVEPTPGVICTSPVQTYLDLAAAGDRGREAADHLRRERLTWQN